MPRSSPPSILEDQRRHHRSSLPDVEILSPINFIGPTSPPPLKFVRCRDPLPHQFYRTNVATAAQVCPMPRSSPPSILKDQRRHRRSSLSDAEILSPINFTGSPSPPPLKFARCRDPLPHQFYRIAVATAAQVCLMSRSSPPSIL